MKFSIVITYYPPGKKPEVLDSIKKIDFPKKDYEILDLPGTGSPSIYRNKGADKGKAKIIVFIDDDAIAHKDLLKNAEKFFKEHPETDIVGGPQLTPFDEKGFAKISGYALSSKFGGWNTSSRYSKKKLNLNADDTYLTTAIMSCRKDVFKKIRLDEDLFPGEDSKFVKEAKEAGLKVAYCPDLIVYHRRRPTLKKFIKQIFSYGKVGTSRESPAELIKRPFFLVPSLFLIYLADIILLGIANPLLLRNIPGIFFGDFSLISLFFVPLLLYLFLDLLFSIYESLKNKNIFTAFPLFFIFPILHLSYGAGMLCGFFKREKK